jgi:branched-chain amino acid transport system permease protein
MTDAVAGPASNSAYFRPTSAERIAPFAVAALVPFILEIVSIDLGYHWKIVVGSLATVVLASLAWRWTPRGQLEPREEMRMWKTPDERALVVIVIVITLALPFILAADFDPPWGLPWATWFRISNFILVFAMGAAAFNLLVGYTGQISFAHVAFLIVGTIVAAQIGIVWGLSFWLVIPASLVAGAVVGVIVGLPALRLRGLYLLLATLGVHFVMLLIWKDYLEANFGFVGASFPDPTVPSWLHWLPFIEPDENGEFLIDSQFRWYWVLLPITAATFMFLSNVIRTREGRAFMAVRERDISATLLGIDVARPKLVAFAVSSAVVAMSGALLSYLAGARGEESFTVQLILNYAIIIVVGGFSSMQGAIFGSIFFWASPQLFQWAREELPLIRSIEFFNDHPNEIDLAVKGMLVVIILVVKPEGLAGIWSDAKTAVLSRFSQGRDLA